VFKTEYKKVLLSNKTAGGKREKEREKARSGHGRDHGHASLF
jgi:hypothetical protein